MAEFNAELNKRLEQTSLMSPECGSSWYKDPKTGKLVAPAPWNASACSLSLALEGPFLLPSFGLALRPPPLAFPPFSHRLSRAPS